MAQPERAEIWLADLGLAAKVRPVLVVSVPYSDTDYALICVIPRTTTPRGAQFEVRMQVPGLEPGLLICKVCWRFLHPNFCGG
jgi:mRNA interferase MazF